MNPSPSTYDVCVIGSGPAGGVLAKELTEKGAKVILLEAGRRMTPKDFLYHSWPYQLPLRGTRLGPQPAAAFPADLARAIRYVDSDPIGLDRIRALGGRSLHWNAVCLRFAARDFRAWSEDGVEQDWPLKYEELAPDYSHVEKMIGVTGSIEHLDIVPDGVFLPALKLRCSEVIIKRVCEKMGFPLIPARKAVLTVPYDNRPQCHYCGHCMRGCDVGAIFTVPDSMLPKAELTGNFTLATNKIARALLVNKEGLVQKVAVVDRETKKEEEIQAKAFAICCGAPESARLLLNSKSPRYPNGLANNNDMVGRYLHGNIAGNLIAYLEDLIGTPPVNNDGATDHAYIPRFNLRPGARKPDYVGGYHYQLNYAGFMFPQQTRYLDGFGRSFKERVRTLQPGFVQMASWGKVLARPENRITVDPHRTDDFGIPIPLVHFRFADNDIALWKDSLRKGREILEAAKAKYIFNTNQRPAGFGSHETGSVCMGKDPRTSVLNSYCQAHEVKNLFVVGGSAFTTFSEKNPTLTIMALAVRTARYMARAVQRHEL